MDKRKVSFDGKIEMDPTVQVIKDTTFEYIAEEI